MNSEASTDLSPEIDDQRDEFVAVLSALETKRPRRRWPWALVALAIASVLFFRLRAGSEGTTTVPESRPTAVRVAAVARDRLSTVATYAGELRGEVSDIAPQVSGLLREVPFRIGDTVRRGQLLALIDDANLRNQLNEAKGQLGVAVANRRRAIAEREGVEADYRRSVDLYSAELISDQEHDRVVSQLATSRANVAASDAQVEQARAREALLEAQFADTRVLAPFSGTVSERYLDRGALVQPGTPILRLVERAPLIVQFRVPERDLLAIRSGVGFSLTTQATGRTVYNGEVKRLSGEVSRTDRTVLVEGELAEGTEELRSGMYAQVQVRTKEIESAKIVPGTAVLERVGMDGAKATGVLIADGDSARWVPVEALGQSRGRVAIEGAVDEGDLVLTLGHTELEDGSAIRVVQQEEIRGSGSLQPSVEESR